MVSVRLEIHRIGDPIEPVPLGQQSLLEGLAKQRWSTRALAELRHRLVARVSEFARLMIVSEAETGRKRLRIAVTIDSRMIVPRRDYEVMVSIRQIIENLRSFRNSSRAFEAVFDDNRTEFGWKPAAKSAVEALKRWICDDQSKVACPICKEEAMSGSHMIGMPCSHMFHGNCLLVWLDQKNHTCPLCRFSLPTD